MTIAIAHDDTVVTQGGSSNPITGKFQATILSTKKDEFGIVKRPFAKQGANTGITALGIRFRIDDDQPGAGKNVFVDVPLARKFAATGYGKYPDGTPAFLFFQFFRSLGYDVDQPSGFTLPEDNAIIGQKLELQINLEYNNEGEIRERVQFINPVSITSLNTKTRDQIDAAVAAWVAKNPAPTGRVAEPAAAAPAWTPGGNAPAATGQPNGWQPSPGSAWTPGASVQPTH